MSYTQRVVALDIRGILGNISPTKILYETLIGSSTEYDKYLQHFVGLLQNGLLRPNLDKILGTLQLWKQQGRIDSVDIFTTEFNTNNWIVFLVECLEIYANTPKLFNRIISGEECQIILNNSGKYLLKDLSRLSNNRNQVVIIQGKPEYIVNGLVIAIPDYNGDIYFKQFKNYIITNLDVESTEADKFLSKYIEENLNKQQYNEDYNEEVISDIIYQLKTIFPSPNATSDDINL